MKISGEFSVEIQPLDVSIQGQGGVTLGRRALRKTFTGALQAHSEGEMLSAHTPVQGSAGYIAIEQVSGTLSGRQGSFVLLHFGVMQAGSNRLVLEVVPDSGAGELTGLVGKMAIRIEGGVHFYEFDYEIAGQ